MLLKYQDCIFAKVLLKKKLPEIETEIENK